MKLNYWLLYPIDAHLSVGFFNRDGTPKDPGPLIPSTGVDEAKLRRIGEAISSFPSDFNVHKGTHTLIAS